MATPLVVKCGYVYHRNAWTHGKNVPVHHPTSEYDCKLYCIHSLKLCHSLCSKNLSFYTTKAGMKEIAEYDEYVDFSDEASD